MKKVLIATLSLIALLVSDHIAANAQLLQPKLWILDITPDNFGGFFNPFYHKLGEAKTGYEISVVKKWQEITPKKSDVVVLLIATIKAISTGPSTAEKRRLQGLSALEGYSNQTMRAGGLNGNVPESKTYSDALKAASSGTTTSVAVYNMIVTVYDQCNSPSYVLTNFDIIISDYEAHGVENARRVIEFLGSLGRR